MAIEKTDIVLNVDGVTQYFGKNRVLYDVDLKIVRGQFVAVVGHSGCGKSTLLKAVEGTQLAKEGEVYLDGVPITKPSRNVGMVHQKYSLYDFLTAEQNVAFGLMLDQTDLWQRAWPISWLPVVGRRPGNAHLPKGRLYEVTRGVFDRLRWCDLYHEHLKQARELLVKLRLDHALSHFPSELSGGMQQRVAIAQSLVMKPKILLLDEPFSALDEATRNELHQMLLVLYAENIKALKEGQEPPYTVMLITHELNDAFYCCDRVIGLSKRWSHETKAGKIYGRDLGATKVYDKAAPIHAPNDVKNLQRFHHLIQDLRTVVFNEKNLEQDRYEHVSFWGDLANNIGTGVALEAINEAEEKATNHATAHQ
jgi:NitT/TauT family transport system ATP-binding protein